MITGINNNSSLKVGSRLTLNNRDNLVDVVLVVRNSVVRDGELSVTRESVAVTVGKIVDDYSNEYHSVLLYKYWI